MECVPANGWKFHDQCRSALNWFIAGAVIGMLIIFTYRKQGTLSARYVRLGPTRLLLFGAALGAVIFGLPLWLCSTILDALGR
jgi:hypothetical protein